jgi:hypothetical protein
VLVNFCSFQIKLIQWILNKRQEESEMKKNYCLSLLVAVSITLISSNAFAGWGSLETHWVAPDDDYVVYFIPALPGGRTHKIELHHYAYDIDNNYIWCEGGVKMYWLEYPNVTTLHLFGDYGVTNRTESTDLYAGNDNIFFKFVFHNYHDKSIQFVWRFYTDD